VRTDGDRREHGGKGGALFGHDTGKQKMLRELVEQVDYDGIAHVLEADPGLAAGLVELLEDPSNDIVDTAARAIWNLGRGDDFSVPVSIRNIAPRLLALLNHRSRVTRVEVVKLIGEFAGRLWEDNEDFDLPFIPRLVELLRDSDPELRKCAAEAIRAIAEDVTNDEYGSGDVEVLRNAVPVLQDLLREPATLTSAAGALTAVARRQPAWALGSIQNLLDLYAIAQEPGAYLYAAALLRLLAEEDSECAKAAEPLLRSLLSYPWPAVQQSAALAMGFLGAETQDGTVQRIVTELLQDRRELMREAAARVLARKTA
jgi:hypothetical protein